MDTRLTPLDIQDVRFGVTFRGYDRREVDAFLDKIAAGVEQDRAMIKSLREQAAGLEVQLLELRKKEAALNNTLVAAQQVVEEMRRNAQKEVDLRIKEAELQAERLTQEAWEQLRRIKQEINDARREKALFLERWRSTVKTMERALVLASEGEAAPGDAKSTEASRASSEQIKLTSST
jgi:cell division initiation protein